MKTILWLTLLMIPYLTYMNVKYGMTTSISETYRHTNRWEKIWYIVTLWLTGIPLMVVGIELSNPDDVLVLWLIAGGLICLIAASPAFWENNWMYRAHMIGSFGGIITGMIALLVHLWSIETIVLVSAFGLFAVSQFAFKKYRVRNYIYWIEVAAITVAAFVECLY